MTLDKGCCIVCVQKIECAYLYDHESTCVFIVSIGYWVLYTEVYNRVHSEVGVSAHHERFKVTHGVRALETIGVQHTTIHVVYIIPVQFGHEGCSQCVV